MRVSRLLVFRHDLPVNASLRGRCIRPPGFTSEAGSRCQNATRTPPLAVPMRLWSDIAMPSTAPNSATFLAV